MHQIAFGEHGAAGGDVGGLLRRKGDGAEFLNLYAQAVCLAGKEGARSRSAQRVHGVVGGDPVFHADDLRVLAADLQDGAHIGVQVRGADGMGGDLVLHHGGAQDRANQAARAAGRANGHHVDLLFVYLAAQVFHHAAGGVGGVAFRPQIGAGDNRSVGRDDNAFGGNRSGVDTEECVCHQRAFLIAIMS